MYNGMLRRVCAEEGASEVCVCVYVCVCACMRVGRERR